jgi:DNA primase
MRISEIQIQQVKDANNIVDVIGEHVQLRKRGRNYVGLCPFHNEKSPSFNVQEEKGIFKCFGCGKGGDVFTFMMESEALSFTEAAVKLAERANITLDLVANDKENEEQSEREILHNTARAAAGHYFKALRAPEGSVALAYLRNRKLSDDLLRKFGVGYAPEPSNLQETLSAQGFQSEHMEKAGIISKSSSGGWYDRFRGRIIFPVFSATGRIIGFGGRVLPKPQGNADVAKYVNSPDTQIYHKSQVLYGLFQAKEAIRKQGFALLVEGYVDVLAVFQGGFENVVAASGTSLTLEQLDLLKRYTKSIVLLFDADQAGKNATVRGIELAIQAGFDVNTVVLPGGEDPDSFLRNQGREAFAAQIEKQQSFIETKAQWFDEQGMFHDPAKHAVAIHSIVETIAKVPDPIKRELYARRVATRFRVLESTLLSELQIAVKRLEKKPERFQPRQSEGGNTRQDFTSSVDLPVVNLLISEPPSETELTLLKTLLGDPHGVRNVIVLSEFSIDLLRSEEVKTVILHLIKLLDAGVQPDTASLLAEFRGREEEQRLIVDCSIAGGEFNANPDASSSDASDGSISARAASQIIAGLMRKELVRELDQVREQLGRAMSNEEMDKLMQASLLLSQRLEKLKNPATAHTTFTVTDE